MRLYNRTWTRREIEERVGRIEQIGGVQRMRLAEGVEDGVDLVRVQTGAGLSFDVLPSRGLDIHMAAFGATPIAWQSPAGIPHPSFYDHRGTEWLRTAAGGLLMTCGLMNVGKACEEEDRQYGFHGRIHHQPARQVIAEGVWSGDEYELIVKGVIDEVSLFGEHLRLTREIRSRLGENTIHIRDVVENMGFDRAAHMIMYHFNFGFPLLDEQTELEFPKAEVAPTVAGVPLEGYDRWQVPEVGCEERVYIHSGLQGEQWATARIRNQSFPLSGGVTVPLCVELSWDKTELPTMVQWKMPGQGSHVLGLEPANCFAKGRIRERELGSLVMLEPGERKVYNLALSFRNE